MAGVSTSRRRIGLLTVVVLAIAGAAWWRESSRRAEPVHVRVDAGVSFQTLTGWQATAHAQQDDPRFSEWSEELFDRAVDELGITRLRIEVTPGMERSTDVFMRDGRHVPYTPEFFRLRYTSENDDADPLVTDATGFHFSALDDVVRRIAIPIRERLEKRGERLWFNMCFVAFNADYANAENFHLMEPDEYAEFVLTVCRHMRSEFGVEPNSWVVILEPDNGTKFDGERIGRCVAAAGPRLRDDGFATTFVLPSTTNARHVLPFARAALAVPGAEQYVSEISTHAYWGANDETLAEIAAFARERGLRTSMLEMRNGDAELLHRCLVAGENSAWSLYSLAAVGGHRKRDGRFYRILLPDDGPPIVEMREPVKVMRHWTALVRPGDVRVQARVESGHALPSAFRRVDGGLVVNVLSDAARDVTVHGLPPGTYRLIETTAAEHWREFAARRVGADGQMRTAISGEGVLSLVSAAR